MTSHIDLTRPFFHNICSSNLEATLLKLNSIVSWVLLVLCVVVVVRPLFKPTSCLSSTHALLPRASAQSCPKVFSFREPRKKLQNIAWHQDDAAPPATPGRRLRVPYAIASSSSSSAARFSVAKFSPFCDKTASQDTIWPHCYYVLLTSFRPFISSFFEPRRISTKLQQFITKVLPHYTALYFV